MLCLFLPETKGRELPDSIEDTRRQAGFGVRSFGRNIACTGIRPPKLLPPPPVAL